MGELYRLDFKSGKSYIGITRNTACFRFIGHKSAAEKSAKGIIYSAWRKHGKPSLVVLAVLEEKDLYEAEKRAIAVFGTRYPQGYNMTDGGETPPSLSPEVATKISKALKGRRVPEETRLLISKSRTGMKHTEKTKRNMSKAQKGRTFSPLAIKRMAAAKTGKKLSSEVKKKMSESQRARRAAEGCTPQRWRYP